MLYGCALAFENVWTELFYYRNFADYIIVELKSVIPVRAQYMKRQGTFRKRIEC